MKITWTVLLSLYSLTAWSEDLKPQFEAGTSFIWGQAFELVLRDGTYKNPLSRLTWEIPPSAGFLTTLEWPWTRRTSTRVSLLGAWPLMSGSAIDEDWNTGYPDYLIRGKSVGEGRLTSLWSASFEQTLQVGGFQVFGGGLYRMTSWESWNGTYDYSYDPVIVTSGSHTSGTYSGLTLEYRQVWIIPYVGASVPFSIDGWSLRPSMRLSPYSWCFDTDNHMLAAKRFTFQDATRGGVYGQVAFEAATRTGSVDWGMRFGWEIDWGAIGDTTQTEPQADYSSSGFAAGAAGAWFHELALTFFVRN